MLTCITSENKHLYRDLLDKIYRLRYEVLVKKLNWHSLYSDGEREIDQYDNEDAVYLVKTAPSGHILSTARLNPCKSGSLTLDQFSDLVQFRDIQNIGNAWEVSRFLNGADVREGLSLNRSSYDIMCGLLEWGLKVGAQQFIALATVRHMTFMLESGVKITPLGWPSQIEGDECLAIEIPVERSSLSNIYHFSRNAQPRLADADILAMQDVMA